MPESTMTPDWAAPAAPEGAGYLRATAAAPDRTVVTRACAASPLRLLTPNVTPATAWVVMATLGGGLVGGDVIDLDIDVEPQARVLLLSQASTKVYRSTRPACQRLHARIGDGALLASLPDPIIAFASSTFEQRQRFELAATGSIVVLDGVLAGRQASGERWAFDRCASRLEVVRTGRPSFVDHVRLDRSDGAVAERMRSFNVFLLAIAVGPLVASLVTSWHQRIGATPVERGADLVASVVPIDGGAALRIAAGIPERALTLLRDVVRPIVALVGDDPWARRW